MRNGPPSTERANAHRASRRRRAAFARDERGAVLVEFGIVLPILILLIFGIIEFSYAYWIKNSVTHAARDGARFAIVRGTESGRVTDSAGVANYVLTRVPLQPSGSLVVRTTWPTNKDAGSLVRVNVSYPFQPLSSLGIIGARTISSTSQMVISY